MTLERETHLRHLYTSLRDLTDGQIGWIETVVEQFHKPASFQHSPRGNPGYDITIGGLRFSLKTQANKGISSRYLHISKFMELGRGTWTDQEEDFMGLREQFFRHMESSDRILSLRRLRGTRAYPWYYELVEIPKNHLLEARNGVLRIIHQSRQFPKPAYYDVTDSSGDSKFQLYFDAGGERKLQIKGLKKTSCIVHAEWRFETSLSENDSLLP